MSGRGSRRTEAETTSTHDRGCLFLLRPCFFPFYSYATSGFAPKAFFHDDETTIA